jgi:hypothetical protein
LASPNTRAKSYLGVNLVTWDKVNHAKSYTLLRKDTNTGIVDTIYTGTQALYHIDQFKAGSNRLIDGHTYEYTVTAWGSLGNTTDTPFYSAADGWNDIVEDSSSSASVKANIPAITAAVTPVKVPTAEDLTVKTALLSGSTTNEVVVTWTDPEPTFNTYKVEYIYTTKGFTNTEGKDLGYLPVFAATAKSIDQTNGNDGQDSTGILNPTKRVQFPLLGGETKIRVTASWPDYWYESKTVTKDFTGAYTVLPAVTGFVVSEPTAPIADSTANNVVELTWNTVVGADAYEIWKAPLQTSSYKGTGTNTGTDAVTASPGSTDDTNDNVSSAITSGLAGNWELVQPYQLTRDPASVKWTAQDVNVKRDTNYVYFVIATTTAGARSNAPSELKLVKGIIPVVYDHTEFGLKTPVLGVSTSSFSGYTARKPYWVTANWDAKVGETYKLERAVVAFTSTNAIDDLANVNVTGTTWETLTAATKTNDGLKYYFSDNPEIRQSYVYRLTAEKTGATTKVFYTALDSGDFTNEVTAGITATYSPSKINSIAIAVTPAAGKATADLSVEIYRAETSLLGAASSLDYPITNGSSIWSKVGSTLTFSGTPAKASSTDTFATAKVGVYFTYRFVITSTTGKVINVVQSIGQTASASDKPSVLNLSSWSKRSGGISKAIQYVPPTSGAFDPTGGKVYWKVTGTGAPTTTTLAGTVAYTETAITEGGISAKSYYVVWTNATLEALPKPSATQGTWTYTLISESENGLLNGDNSFTSSNVFTTSSGTITW